MFLAETYFESMDGRLGWMLVWLGALFFLILIAGGFIESKLVELIRIQRASHELLKGIAESLKQIADAQKEPKALNAPAPPTRQDITSLQGSTPDTAKEPGVYKI